MITKVVNLNVKNGYVTKLSNPIEFYSGDKVKLIFNLSEIQVDLNRVGSSQVISPQKMVLDGMTAELLLEYPGNIDTVRSVSIEDNSITFILSEELTSTVGTHKCQLVLTDEDGYRITLPEFKYTIKETIYDNQGEIFATDEEIINTINNIFQS